MGKSVWKKDFGKIGLLCSILLLGYFTQLITGTGFLIIIGFAGLAGFYSFLEKDKNYSRFLYHSLAIVIFAVTLAFYRHLIPGFNNVLYFNKIQVSEDAVPFTMYVNIDKLLAGLVLLLFVIPLGINIISGLKKVWYLFVIMVVLLISLTLLFHFVRFDFKFQPYFLIWGINNLFIVSMAEEALFRGFFQRHLSLLKMQNSDIIAVFIAGLGFGLMHWQGGIKYVSYAVVAGVLYGLIYRKSQNIVVSILAHFLFNVIHIIFFTYPFLK